MKRLPVAAIALAVALATPGGSAVAHETDHAKPRKPRQPRTPEMVRSSGGDGGRSAAPSPRAAPVTQPAPTPTVQPSTTLDTNAVGHQIARLWPYDDRQALSVADCESGDHDGLPPYVPTAGATGKAAERGPFQIHPTHANDLLPRLGLTWRQMYDVGPNVAAAIALYEDRGGWGHWTCKPK